MVVQNSALQTPMLHALHAPRVRSLKLVLQKRMALHQSVLPTATAMVQLVQTEVDTRVVQRALHMVATIAHLAQVIVTHVRLTATAMSVATLKTAVDTRVVQSVLHTVVQVQLPVVATVAK